MSRIENSHIERNNKLLTVGSYFVDVFYNKLYHTARAEKAEYQDIAVKYISSMRSDASLLKRLIDDVFKYYKHYMRADSMTYQEFIEEICRELTTREMQRKLRKEQEQEFVAQAFYELLAKLGVFMTGPDNIKNVINEENRRGEIAKVFTENVREQSVAILLSYKTRISNSFIEKNTGIKSKVNGIQEVEGLKKAIKNLILRNIELTKQVEKYKRRWQKAEDTIRELEQELDNGEEDEDESQSRMKQPSKMEHPSKMEIPNKRENSRVNHRTDEKQKSTGPKIDASFFGESKATKNESRPDFRLPGEFNGLDEESQNPTHKSEEVRDNQLQKGVPHDKQPKSNTDDSLEKLERMVEEIPINN